MFQKFASRTFSKTAFLRRQQQPTTNSNMPPKTDKAKAGAKAKPAEKKAPAKGKGGKAGGKKKGEE
jgi:hypothetical protein